MPIRAINDKQYKGVSELYRNSDGQVTGYYVTYRDKDSKPIKKRVDAKNRDEALLKLIEIKHIIDLEKQRKTINAALPKQVKSLSTKVTDSRKSLTDLSEKTMQNHQKIISAYKDVAIVLLIDIVAFDDINILYGYETGMRMVDVLQTIIHDSLQEMDSTGVFAHYGVKIFSYDLYHVYADKLCLFIRSDFNYRLIDIIVKALLTQISNHKFIISDESHIPINVTIGATKGEGSMSLMYAEKALQEAKKYQSSYIFHDSNAIKKEHISNNVYETLITNIKDENDQPVTVTELNEVKSDIRLLRRELFSDDLTQCKNRLWIFKHKLNNDENFSDFGSVISIKIAEYDSIVKEYDSNVGNKLLKLVSDYMIHYMKKQHIRHEIVRYSKDNFLIFVHDLNEKEVDIIVLNMQRSMENYKFKHRNKMFTLFFYSAVMQYINNESFSSVLDQLDEKLFVKKIHLKGTSTFCK